MFNVRQKKKKNLESSRGMWLSGKHKISIISLTFNSEKET